MLWECFIKRSENRSGGYIKKMKILWGERGLISRQEACLISKFKCIERGLLTKTKRNETEKKVKYENKKRKCVEQRKSKISKNQCNVLSGSSGNEEVFESF